jgi:metallo-beta-lactamase family protein
MAEVTFYGACGCVTGSSTLLTWGETRILVDCGLYQGDEELEARNWRPFPYPPESLTAVILTHAHLDHTGLLPRLGAQGFRGPVHCTRASRGLISLVLEDSGEIQEEEARYAQRKGYSRHPDPKPLYTRRDVRRVLKTLEPRPFEEQWEIVPGIRVRFRRAGHLLGAATVEVSAKGSDGERRTWCFSGDVGRYDVPILKDPEPPLDPPAALLLESTYGDRRHVETETRDRLREILDETFDRGGVVIVPAFALGRTQEILYHLSVLADEGELDPDAVFLDSPMAISATELYERATREHDEELAELVRNGSDPLGDDRFHRCRTSEESKRLNGRHQPTVIVAASGMATGGRVVHHLLHRLGDERNSVVFVGYQAAGTRGRALVNGADTVAIHGQRVRVKAEIHYLRSLSAHADSDELERWCRALPGVPERIFLNHGEDPARKALEVHRVALGWPRPHLPSAGSRFPW